MTPVAGLNGAGVRSMDQALKTRALWGKPRHVLERCQLG